jgi:uridylate kinase
MQETIIISLGGSLIVPENIDVDFLKSFRDLIISYVKKGRRFVIITGGGKICRKYQEVAKEISNASALDLDWIGIASLKLNAELLRVILGDYAHNKVIPDLSSEIPTDRPIIIGSAFGPGRSTDWDAVKSAETLHSKKIINLSNTDYVYDSDPKTNPNAQKIEKISWKDYRTLIPKEWNPGLNTPFDPVASQVAEENGMTVSIMNGRLLQNLAKCLDGEDFVGTVIY